MSISDNHWWSDNIILEAIGTTIAAAGIGAWRIMIMLFPKKRQNGSAMDTNGNPIPLGPAPGAEIIRQEEMFKFFNRFENALADTRDEINGLHSGMNGIRNEIEGFRGEFRTHVNDDKESFVRLEELSKK